MILVTWAGGINRGREQGRRREELEREERASRKYEEEEFMEGEIKQPRTGWKRVCTSPNGLETN